MPDFAWGDTVRVATRAQKILRPGAVGAVVGIREIENEEQASQFGGDIGTKLYLIEFGDGASVEVPERELEAVA